MSLLTNLVGYWKFDETAGATTAADQVAGNTLTKNGSATFASGKISNGTDLEFSTGDYWSITDGAQTGLDMTGNFSISGWFKLESQPSASQMALVSKRDTSNHGYSLKYNNSGGNYIIRLSALTGASEITIDYSSASPILANGVFAHVATTWDTAGNAIIYLNGLPVKTSSSGGSPTGTATPFTIGDSDTGSGASGINYDGIIDEVGVWSRVLTPDEVLQLYNNGSGLAYALSPSTSTLLAYINNYWKLDETSGNAVDSVSGNTLTNNNTVAYSTGKVGAKAADFGASNSTKNLTSTTLIPFDGTSDFTIACWANITTAPSNSTEQMVSLIKSTNNSTTDLVIQFIYGDTAGSKYVQTFTNFTVSSGNNKYTTTLTTGTWYHLVFTHVSTADKLYINGSLVNTATLSANNNFAAHSSVTAVGSNIDNTGYLSGLVDEVGIWTRAITATEASALYNSGLGFQYPFSTNSSGFLAFF